MPLLYLHRLTDEIEKTNLNTRNHRGTFDGSFHHESLASEFGQLEHTGAISRG